MYEKIFVFAADADSSASLVSALRASCEKLYLLCPDSAAVSGADEVYTYPASESFVCRVRDAVQLIKDAAPQLLVCDPSADGRLLAGYAAAALHCSPLCDVMSLETADDGVTAARMVYGGAATEAVRTSLPAVVTAAAGLFPAAECAPAASTKAIPYAENNEPKLLSVSHEASVKKVNLAAAKKIVGIGRGISSADNIPAAEKLAGLLGAEIGCTRPVAEEEHWYPKERYIGVSGCMTKPELYLALGISGQIQHMVGVNQAGVIFAVDKSENAPIFAQADHCLVADINTALPALIELLSK